MQPSQFIRKLSFKAKTTYVAHLFKAVFKTYHEELIPLFRPHIKKDAVIIDVGGHSGQTTKLFSQMAPQGHVYVFEPGLYAQSIISKVIQLKKFNNVTLETVGLSNERGEAELVAPLKTSGSVGFGRSHVSYSDEDDNNVKHTIQLITLDDYIADKYIRRVDFLKVDIEGHEMKMFYGATKTIDTFRPVVYTEAIDEFLERSGNSIQELWDFFIEKNYRIYLIDKDLNLIECPNPANGDILCIPE